MRIFYTSDLHGEPGLYQQLYRVLDSQPPEAVILGGDICPTRFGPDGPPLQRRFLATLLERIDHYGARGMRFYFIFGNADCGANWEWLVSQARPHAVPLHERVEPLDDGLVIAGYSCVPITPLALKDWEKRDQRVTGAERWDGIRTHEAGVSRVNLETEDPADTLAADLARLEVQLAGRRAICVMHSPPSDTALDCIAPDRHVGSVAAREFLLRVQAPLALHGHIHESPWQSGRYADRVGDCLCVNPGQDLGGELHGVWFDTGDIENSMQHTVFGKPPEARQLPPAQP